MRFQSATYGDWFDRLAWQDISVPPAALVYLRLSTMAIGWVTFFMYPIARTMQQISFTRPRRFGGRLLCVYLTPRAMQQVSLVRQRILGASSQDRACLVLATGRNPRWWTL